MIQQMLAIWPLAPLPFLNLACISGSSRFTYCWSLAWRILSMTLLACEMSTSPACFPSSSKLLEMAPGPLHVCQALHRCLFDRYKSKFSLVNIILKSQHYVIQKIMFLNMTIPSLLPRGFNYLIVNLYSGISRTF